MTTATSFWSNHDESTATGGAIGRAGPPTGTSWRASPQKQQDPDPGATLGRAGPPTGTSWRAAQKAQKGLNASAGAVKEALATSSPKLVRGPFSQQSEEKQSLRENASKSSGFWNPPVTIGRGAQWSRRSGEEGGTSSENLPI